MKGKDNFKKVLSTTLVITMVGTNIVYASSLKKDETVYVIMDQSGKVKEEVVSDWLHSELQGIEVKDKSDLSGIKNVKGDEAPTQNGTDLTWKMNGNDIYYTGTTDKALPFEIAISYYLNDIKVNPNDLGGKSGRLKIIFGFKNKEAHKVVIDEKEETIYSPMAAALTMELPTDIFKTVNISSGNIISDGENKIVTFVALPGLKESLDLNNCNIDEIKDIAIPDELIITSDVENFKMGPVGIVVTANVPYIDKLNIDDNYTELKNSLKELTDAKNYIDLMDPDSKLKTLITDSKKVEESRKLLKDAFDFYAMDKSLINLAPEFITKENISLVDKLFNNYKSIRSNNIINEKLINSFRSRLSSQNIENARKLLNDADTINTFDMSKLDKVEKLIGGYDNIAPMLQNVNSLMAKMNQNEASIETLKVLAKYSNSLAGLIGNVSNMDMSMLTKDDLVYGIRATVSHKEEQMEALLDSSDVASRTPIAALLDEGFLQKENSIKEKAIDNEALTIINQALAKDPTNSQLLQLKAAAEALISNMVPEDRRAVTEQTVKTGAIAIIEAQKSALDNALKMNVIPDTVKLQIKALIKVGFDETADKAVNSIESILNQVALIDSQIKNELGSDYRADIQNSFGFINSIMPDIQAIQSEAIKNKAYLAQTLGFLNDKETINYLKDYSIKLVEMKEDLDKNQENIATIKELLAIYDDPSTKTLLDSINEMESNLNEVKPIIMSLNNKLNDEAISKCLQNSPEDVAKLMNMKKDLENYRDIIETLNTAIEQGNIDMANKVVKIMDELKEENDLDEYNKKLESVDELIKRKDELVKFSNENKIFTAAAKDMDANVKYIIKTDEIKRPEVVKEISTNNAEKNSEGFFNKIKNFFSKIVSAIL